MSDKKKWYAVFFSRKPFAYGFLFTSWAECEKLVKGRSEVRYKKFSDEQSAKDYLNDFYSAQNLENRSVIENGFGKNLPDEIKTWSSHLVDLDNLKKDKKNIQIDQDLIEIYVDGSHLADHQRHCAWGFAAIQNDKLKAEDYGVTEEESKSRNIVGEVHAALNAMKWFYQYKEQHPLKKNLKGCILHDYTGIAKWATDAWKTKQPISVWYQYETKKIIDKSISFKKVEAHCGNKWNEYVDEKTRSFLKDFIKKQKSKNIY